MCQHSGRLHNITFNNRADTNVGVLEWKKRKKNQHKKEPLNLHPT